MIDIIKTLSAEKSEKEEMFGEGPWITEVDFMEFVYLGYTCYINRAPHGALCGYVEIPDGHPWEGKHYDDIPCECHGGLTFCNEREERKLLGGKLVLDAITRQEGEPFNIGFDCAHSYDIAPAIEKFRESTRDKFLAEIPEIYKDLSFFNPVYRTINFVIEECKSIVDQAIEAQKQEK